MANLTGQDVGRYHIIETLGEGGMAVVYKAFDKPLDREVAIKCIRTSSIPPDSLGRLLTRFEREAKRMAKFAHPNIVPIIDYGHHEGTPYLVMPYLPGGTLKDHMKALAGKPMDYRDAARLLAPVARALEYAHERDTIHRDVKPSNILLTENGQAILTDFGVAKILDVGEGQTLTGTGIGLGTPKYMAPEQWQNIISAQTDIYGLGVIFYELVTGRTPYDSETPAGVLAQQLTEPLPEPRSFNPNLPAHVEQVLYKTLAKNPADRYEDMGQLATRLEQLATYPQDDSQGLTVNATIPRALPSRESDVSEMEPPREPMPAGKSTRGKGKKISPWIWVAGGSVLVFALIAVVVLLSLLNILSFNQGAPIAPKVSATSTTQGSAIMAESTDSAEPVSQVLPTSTAPKPREIVDLAKCMQGVPIISHPGYQPIFCDDFIDNENKWDIGVDQQEEFGTTRLHVKDSRYIWDVSSKNGFFDWQCRNTPDIENFEASVLVERIRSPNPDACYAIVFRHQEVEGVSNLYGYFVCNNNTFSAIHESGESWEYISFNRPVGGVRPEGPIWLSVVAEGSNIEFYVNTHKAGAVRDERLKSGQVCIGVEIPDNTNAVFAFDKLVIRAP